MRLLAIDTETEMVDFSQKFATSRPAPALVCLTAAGTGCGAELFMYNHGSGSRAVLEAVILGADAIVFHNAAFDLGVIAAWDPWIADEIRHKPILDTRVLYFLANPDPADRRVSLQRLAKELLEVELEKGDTRVSFRRGVPLTQEQEDYAKQDAIITLRVAEKLLELKPAALAARRWGLPAYEQQHISAGVPECKAAATFSYVAARVADMPPLRLDPVALREADDTLRAELRQAERELISHGLMKLKRRPKAAVIAHYDAVPAGGPVCSKSWTRMYDDRYLWRQRKGVIERVDAAASLDLRALEASFGMFAQEQNIPAPVTKRTKKVSLARDDWKEHEPLLPAPLKLYMKYQKIRKLHSAFVGPLIESGVSQVAPSYWIPGAATGRWSCSGPNLQQLPRTKPGTANIRSIYVPSQDGRIFVSADYPTLEFYCLAETMSRLGIEGPLLRALETEDVHRFAAAMMYGVPESEVVKDQRQVAKHANFGLCGGMGVKRFRRYMVANGKNISIEETTEIRKRWLGVFTDVVEYLGRFKPRMRDLKPDWMSWEAWFRDLELFSEDQRSTFNCIKACGGNVFDVTLVSGRRVNYRSFSAAANCMFQGLGADVITRAVELCWKRGLTVSTVIHDSIFVEAERAEPAGGILRSAMQDALREFCPRATKRMPDIKTQASDRLV